MKHGFDCKEFWRTMKIFLFNKKTVFSQICIEKITELYLMNLICLKILVSFVKILLDCSMSSQMEEELFTSHQLLVTSRQLPLTSYQSLVTSHQLLVTDRQLLVTSHKLLVANYQLLTTHYYCLLVTSPRLLVKSLFIMYSK